MLIIYIKEILFLNIDFNKSYRISQFFLLYPILYDDELFFSYKVVEVLKKV